MNLRKTLLAGWATVALATSFATESHARAPFAQAAQNGSLSGRVTDDQGRAIPNATVALVPPAPIMANMTMAPPPPIPGRIGADGAFTFTGIAAGPYVLQADAPGFSRSSQPVTLPTTQTFAIKLEILEIPGGEETVRPTGQADNQALQAQVAALEQRVRDLESSTVLSEPITRTKKTTVYIDKNNNVFDQPHEGARKTVTYQRERVYRRENINEKIQEALDDQAKNSVQVGVNAAIAPQAVFQVTGDEKSPADRHAYQLASADLFFTAHVAQHTVFFADVVGLSGPPPDLETGGLTLLNGFTARLVRQNELNIREAWLRTEMFSQKLSLVAGRLDLTNYFDHNAAANDETRQFLSDALVNNPTLNLAVNGSGLAAVYDPKGGFVFKVGLQQSKTEATNLSQSLYSLAEVGYVTRLPGLGEGNYRFWGRNDNSTDRNRTGYGTSIDQKLAPQVTWFGRYGAAQADIHHDHFYSTGLQFANGAGFYPGDAWGVGYSHYDLGIGPKERLTEGYYSFAISEKFRLSFHLAHVLEKQPDAPTKGFLVPGIRLQASF
jgi:hypothetical protein